MPVSEVFDYIQLINEQAEAEERAQASATRTQEKPEAATLSDVYRGPIG